MPARSFCLILGTSDANSTDIRTAVDTLKHQGVRVDEMLITTSNQEIELAREAAEADYDAIVAVGGDGTLGNVVNGLMTAEKRNFGGLGIIPMGTANDFATSGQFPTEPNHCLQFIREFDPILVDVGEMDGRYFLNVASGGFGAEVTTSTSPALKDWLGGFAYVLTGVSRLVSLEAKPVRIKAPSFEWEGPLLALAVGNGKQAGGGFELCPRAAVNDGFLDLTIIPNRPLDGLIALMSEFEKLSKTPGPDNIVYQQVTWVEVFASEGLQVNLDGQPHTGRSFRFTNHKRILPLHIPASSRLLQETGERV